MLESRIILPIVLGLGLGGVVGGRPTVARTLLQPGADL